MTKYLSPNGETAYDILLKFNQQNQTKYGEIRNAWGYYGYDHGGPSIFLALFNLNKPFEQVNALGILEDAKNNNRTDLEVLNRLSNYDDPEDYIRRVITLKHSFAEQGIDISWEDILKIRNVERAEKEWQDYINCQLPINGELFEIMIHASEQPPMKSARTAIVIEPSEEPPEKNNFKFN